MDDQRHGSCGNQSYWSKVARRIIGELRVERGIDGLGANRAHEQGVTVGRGVRTLSAPMLPPAPPRLSTRTCWPSCSESFCATGLATMSVGPPGGNGTTSP